VKRSLMLALGLIVLPSLSAAQVEIGLDTGLEIEMVDGFDDNTSFHMPSTWARVALSAGESLLIEPLIGFEYFGEGDLSEHALLLIPGVDYLFGERFYLRGEAGLARYSESDTGFDSSWTQYGLGGGAGIRMRLGDSALLRIEAAVDYWLESTDDGVPQRTDVRVLAGASAVIG